jgi:hypothetical protein
MRPIVRVRPKRGEGRADGSIVASSARFLAVAVFNEDSTRTASTSIAGRT